MFTTILKSSEIIEFLGLDSSFPKCSLRSIFTTEYYEFTECLGTAFYDKLKEDMVKYDCIKYDNDKTYQEGDTVNWKGIVKIAIQETQGNLPDNIEFWEDAPKFKTPCYETLWCLFLGEYLSWQVLKTRLPFISNQITGNGVVKLAKDSKLTPADFKDLRCLDIAINREIEKTFKNMHHYMKHNNSGGCYGWYKGVATKCCGGCGCAPVECTCEDSCLEAKENSGYDYNFG